MASNAIDATVEVLLAGEKISPGKVRSQELAEVVEALEDMMVSKIARARPEPNEEAIARCNAIENYRIR